MIVRNDLVVPPMRARIIVTRTVSSKLSRQRIFVTSMLGVRNVLECWREFQSHHMMRIALKSSQYHLYHSNSRSNPGSTRSRRVVTVGVGISDANVKTFLGKIGDTYIDIADFSSLSDDSSIEDATCGQVCSPLPSPLENNVLGVHTSRNGCYSGLKMNYDTRCDVQCDTSLGYEAATGYYECPSTGGDPILVIDCQQASEPCGVNQRVLNGACVACPPGT